MDVSFNVGRYVELIGDRWGDRTAIVSDGGDRYTYRELNAVTNATARGLRRRGVDPGDAVALLAPNTPEFVITYYATLKLGGVIVPLSFRASESDVEYLVNASESDVLVYDESYADTVEAVVTDPDVDCVAIGNGEFESLSDHDSATVTCPAARSDTAYIAHTSGSTGRPKLIPHTHDHALLGGSQGIHEVGIRRDDRGLALAPLFHTAGMYTFFVPHLYAGATAILQRSFDPESTLALIERERATAIFGVPAQYNAMARREDADAYDTSSLRYIRAGASPMSSGAIERAKSIFAEDFYNTYGLTECQQNVTIVTPDDPPEKQDGIGKASYFWDVRVVEPATPEATDPEAVVDAPGIGMLIVRGPMTMEGYLDQPEKDEDVFVGDWVYTGDVVEIDGDGYLSIVDRMDNMIKSGGENVYPQEVEGVLVEHPNVVDCGVFGQPHEDLGRAIAAVVVTDTETSVDELDEYLRRSDRLADFKRPREYRFVDEIPRSPGSGSIQRGKLPKV